MFFLLQQNPWDDSPERLVGPFATEAEAERAKEELEKIYYPCYMLMRPPRSLEEERQRIRDEDDR